MTYTQEQIDAVHELPLRKDVRWIDMSEMFPGLVTEETKRPFGDGPAEGKWASMQLDSAEMAATVVEAHNEWLENQ